MNLANVYHSQGKYDEALDYHQKSLSIKITTLGNDHRDVANSKYKIANVHESQGQLEEAKALFLECEKIFAKLFGVEHGKTQDARQRAATVGKQKDSVVDHETPVAAHMETAAAARPDSPPPQHAGSKRQ